jgi:hypothetical protein
MHITRQIENERKVLAETVFFVISQQKVGSKGVCLHVSGAE